MKITYNARRYDSEKMEILCERDFYNNSNYAGTGYVVRASDGQLFLLSTSNKLDGFRKDGIIPYSDDIRLDIDLYDMTEEQEKRCAELGLIEIVD